MEEALDHLRRTAAGNLVIVEGRKDVAALEVLGVGGEHVLVHQGRTLQAVGDGLAETAADKTVVLLLDWDRTGGRLCRRLLDALAGRATVDVDCRRRLAKASHERCMEHIPAELAALRGAVRGRASNKG